MTEQDYHRKLKKIFDAMERAPVQPQPASSTVPASAGGGKGVATGETSRAGVLLRLGLTVALGVGIVFWPYAATCGAGLAAYLSAVAVLTGAGVWSAVWTWRHRAPRGHTLALLIVLWGLVLGAIDVLPRMGYAIPTALHPRTWVCM